MGSLTEQISVQGSKVIEVELVTNRINGQDEIIFCASLIDSDTISTISECGKTPQEAVIALMLCVDLYMGDMGGTMDESRRRAALADTSRSAIPLWAIRTPADRRNLCDDWQEHN